MLPSVRTFDCQWAVCYMYVDTYGRKRYTILFVPPTRRNPGLCMQCVPKSDAILNEQVETQNSRPEIQGASIAILDKECRKCMAHWLNSVDMFLISADTEILFWNVFSVSSHYSGIALRRTNRPCESLREFAKLRENRFAENELHQSHGRTDSEKNRLLPCPLEEREDI